ncbi:unnamed protein product [Ilex paraguariensis]|uniref:Uncharacterized protein n=1 Tax=Ilex paraguariensis TaxID=185542 RepID=A0ABC8R3V8_9AQUA
MDLAVGIAAMNLINLSNVTLTRSSLKSRVNAELENVQLLTVISWSSKWLVHGWRRTSKPLALYDSAIREFWKLCFHIMKEKVEVLGIEGQNLNMTKYALEAMKLEDQQMKKHERMQMLLVVQPLDVSGQERATRVMFPADHEQADMSLVDRPGNSGLFRRMSPKSPASEEFQVKKKKGIPILLVYLKINRSIKVFRIDIPSESTCIE